MLDQKTLKFIEKVLENMPAGWLSMTTHRLDIYNEKLAKTQFTDELERLYKDNDSRASVLEELPTAYDYIRLGHPLSCLLEWIIAQSYKISPKNVISFSSKTTPILAILRKNLLDNKKTQINFLDTLPDCFDENIIRRVYGYSFELNQVKSTADITSFDGKTIFLSNESKIDADELNPAIDFCISLHAQLGSILIINGSPNEKYISDIQHVRRRETIAMTPANALVSIKSLLKRGFMPVDNGDKMSNKTSVLASINAITNAPSKALVASSGLSMQYAIMMGLIDYAFENYDGKSIKFIVPTNCYGGTNDQARRVAACIEHVEVVDLAVDGDYDMVRSIDKVLSTIAQENAIPFIIAEIPTNPRVEVPNLIKLKDVLIKKRKTASDEIAIPPVFILDQTFCPNVHFLGAEDILSAVKTISYASGSKFPSGGKCTSGYCVANEKASAFIEKIELHLNICDNEATDLQYKILAEQLPSMTQRIADAYTYTRKFVNYIKEVLPEAKINFVSEALADLGFTPSVFSLDLPTKGNTPQEKEAYKRALNLALINLMISKIPDESKHCVSYGQLKGCYWTVPATSTQGTTKESDKDYIARVALSADMDLELHKEVFLEFVGKI